MKKLIRRLTYRLANQTGLNAVCRKYLRDGNRFIILGYHGITDDNDPCHNDFLQVRKKDFIQQMLFISDHFRPVSLVDLPQALGEKQTKPLAVVTFDDGYDNLVNNAFPILNYCSIPSTVFVVPSMFDRCDETRFFWWDIIRVSLKQKGCSEQEICDTIESYKTRPFVPPVVEKDSLWRYRNALRFYSVMNWKSLETIRRHRYPVSLGSHTQHHDLLTRVDKETVTDTLYRSYCWLKQLSNLATPTVCYPNGWYDDDIVSIAREIGYTIGVTCDERFGGYPTDENCLTLPRFLVGRNMGIHYFKYVVSGSANFLRRLSS